MREVDVDVIGPRWLSPRDLATRLDAEAKARSVESDRSKLVARVFARSRVDRVRRCGKCGSTGHNRRKCNRA